MGHKAWQRVICVSRYSKFHAVAAASCAVSLFLTAHPGLAALAAQSPPSIALSVSSGLPGTPVTVTGSGFPPGEIVAIYVDSAGPYLANPPPGPSADAQGNVRVSVMWPGRNYDLSGHVDPTVPGPHAVCGDTAYPGSTQQIPARACAQFQVVAVASTATAPPANSIASFPVGTVLVAFVVLMLLTGGLLLLTRRSDDQRSRSTKGRGDPR